MLDNFAKLNPHPSDPSVVIGIPLVYYRFMIDNCTWKYPCSFLFFPWPWVYQDDYFSSHLGLFWCRHPFIRTSFSFFSASQSFLNKLCPSVLMLNFVHLNCDSVLTLWGPPVFNPIAYGFLWACAVTSTSKPLFHALLLVRLADPGPKHLPPALSGEPHPHA